MTNPHKNHPLDWLSLLQAIKDELKSLSEADRTWIKARLAGIEAIQITLDELFRKVGGTEACTGCDGACCDCGLHHITLTNLLAYLLNGEEPPNPDFGRACPYLGEQGCRLQVGRRPYNCITFFCEALDDRLDAAAREQLRSLDGQLRKEYQRVSERYPAASLRGLWIALERVGQGQLLRSPSGDVLE